MARANKARGSGTTKPANGGQAKRRIREQSEFLQTILDALGHPFYVIDASDYTIKMANAAARLGPLSKDTTCYALTHKLSGPCSRYGHSCPLEEVKRTKAAVTVEHVHSDKDGNARTYEVHCYPILDGEGNVKEMLESNLDITERKQAERALVRQSALVQAMNRVFEEALTCESEEAVAHTCLAVAEQLTGSKFGFISEVNQAGRFDTIALSDPGWQACRMPNSDAMAAIRDMEIRGLWGKVIRDGRPLIVNDPASHPDRVGTPDGHPPITAFLGVPLKHGGETIGMIGVANKESGYDLADQEDLESLSVTFVEALGRKRAEAALRESEAKYRHIFENMQDIFYRTDAQGIITEISPSVQRYAYTREGLIGTQVLDVYENPEERSALLKALFERGEVVDYEVRLKTGDGRVIPTSVSTRLLRGPDGSFAGVEGVLRDINERKGMEAALREQTRRDPLTGVLNHGAIVDELRKLISDGGDGGPHAVVMVDVDGLKTVNDVYGHQVGDAVLVAVAGALSRNGALVGRYGGDEFVALLPGADRKQAECYRDAVLDTLVSAALTDPETGASVPVVASVGLAIYPTEAGRIEELIKLADSAMYATKRQRPVGPDGRALPQLLNVGRAAKMVEEIVPLLTSPGDLNGKLALVAQRLSVGAGYDGVSLEVYRHSSEAPTAQDTFAEASDELVEAWNREQRRPGWEGNPIRMLLERTRRPVILDDPQNDQRLTETERELLRAAGLRSAIVVPLFWQDKLIGDLSVASKRQAAFGPRDAEFLMSVATQVTAIVRMATLVEDLQAATGRLAEARAETVMMLAAAAEAHDQTTGLHLQNVRATAEALAREVGYGEEDAREVGLAAVLHDIGKIHVPHVVLSTAGRLTDEEWELLKRHTIWGEEFLKGRLGFELAATIARSHHERWDGSGYPDGLSGDDIPEAAAIVAVADALDAMTSDRPYRAARSVAAAVREIKACSGGQFSPRVVEALVRLHKRKKMPRLHHQAVEAAA